MNTEVVRMKDGVPIRVTLFGEPGRTILLVHGLASNGRLWWPVARLLSPYFRVAVPDLRGHGASGGQGGPLGIELATDDLFRCAEELSLEVAAVAGQSWGAAVATCFARRHPSGIELVAMVDGVLERLRDRFGTKDEMLQALTPPDVAGISWESLGARLGERYRGFPEGAVEAALGSFSRGRGGEVVRSLPLPDHLRILSDLFEFDMVACAGEIEARLLVIAALSGNPAEDRRKLEASRCLIEGAARGSQLLGMVADHDVHLQMPGVVGAQLLAALCSGELGLVPADPNATL